MTEHLDASWLDRYFEQYRSALADESVYDALLEINAAWLDATGRGKKVIFCGNGGSAAIASHCSVDLSKTAGRRAINFNEAALITCFANDYGYENWLARAVEMYGDAGDVLVLISSSGRSANVLRAAETANRLGITVITFSGFDADNPLRGSGAINVWIDSHSYNVVEMTHHIWLLAAVDMAVSATRRANGTGAPADAGSSRDTRGI